MGLQCQKVWGPQDMMPPTPHPPPPTFKSEVYHPKCPLDPDEPVQVAGSSVPWTQSAPMEGNQCYINGRQVTCRPWLHPDCWAHLNDK